MSSELIGKIFAGAIFGWMLFRVIRYRGFTGASVGARVQQTVGEVSCAGGMFWRVKLKVHALCYGDPTKAVALEIRSSGLTSFEVNAVALSTTDARKLAALIQSASRS